MPEYQQPCEEQKPFCSSEGSLACVNGKYECETELHVFDAELKRWRRLVASSCKFSNDMMTAGKMLLMIKFFVSNAMCNAPFRRGKDLNGIS